MDSDNEAANVEIPFKELSKDALRAVIEDFVSREGTDYGHEEYTLENKIAQVMKHLESGEAIVTFDQETESCTLVMRDSVSF